MMVARTRRLPGDTAARADATFVTHATWVPERTPSMVARVDADLVLADSVLPCDTFNIVCAEGCDLGVLQAAAAGVYRRLGFERFGEITEYKPGGGFDDS